MINLLQQLFTFELLIFASLFCGAMFIAFLATAFLIRQLVQRNIVATPDGRSMHVTSTPVGGGLVIIALTLTGWLIIKWPVTDLKSLLVPGGALLLALLSFMDDKHQVQARARFSLQIVIIAAILLTLPDQRAVISEVWPLWFDRLATGLCWLWFVNLFNFMDGIDGLAGIEILYICGGLFLIGLATGTSLPVLQMIVVLAGATAGFLWWNWQPAKIFMGDVGAIPVGFLLGWLLISLALDGYLIAAIILPGYFITDATLTLLKRMSRGEKFWEPHRTHFYQRAATGLASHAQVVRKIMVANGAFVVVAFFAIYQPLAAALCGLGVGILILVTLQRDAEK